VADLLPAVARWEGAVSASAPAAAATIARCRQEAADVAVGDPVGARARALEAAAVAVQAAWDELEPPDRDRVLSEARQALRADAERHGGADV
jgi:hypothetical protein